MKKVMVTVLVCLLSVCVSKAADEVGVVKGSVVSTLASTNTTVTLTNRNQNVGIISIDAKWNCAVNSDTGMVTMILDNGEGIPINLYSNVAATNTVSYLDGSGARRWQKDGTVAIYWRLGASSLATNLYAIHSDLK